VKLKTIYTLLVVIRSIRAAIRLFARLLTRLAEPILECVS
jgi:hypothetical protein